MLIVRTYLAFFWVVSNPDNPIAIALSMLPPFAPVLMPARMATGDAQSWQVVLAIVLTLAAIGGLNALAAPGSIRTQCCGLGPGSGWLRHGEEGRRRRA